MAGLIEATLERFQSTGWKRVQGGGRQPKPGIETHCVNVLKAGLLSRRSIWEVLRGVKKPDTPIEMAAAKTEC